MLMTEYLVSFLRTKEFLFTVLKPKNLRKLLIKLIFSFEFCALVTHLKCCNLIFQGRAMHVIKKEPCLCSRIILNRTIS